MYHIPPAPTRQPRRVRSHTQIAEDALAVVRACSMQADRLAAGLLEDGGAEADYFAVRDHAKRLGEIEVAAAGYVACAASAEAGGRISIAYQVQEWAIVAEHQAKYRLMLAQQAYDQAVEK